MQANVEMQSRASGIYVCSFQLIHRLIKCILLNAHYKIMSLKNMDWL